MSARPYAIEYMASAAKQVRKLDPAIRRRVLAGIDLLADDPRPPGCKPLQGRPGYRIRIGDYRVIYEVIDDRLLVVVFAAGPRGSVYR